MGRFGRGLTVVALAASGFAAAAVPTAGAVPVTSPAASSQWPCGDWGMYGGDVARTFSTECPSTITPRTVRTLAPVWTFPTGRPVSASPAVVGDTVYVGDWSGTMYALRLADGAPLWTFRTEPAAGAAFGPIVSSAAVADVAVDGSTTRLVIFGAGPVLYALDAATGAPVWRVDRSAGLTDTPVEFESSAVVHDGVVYVGLDTHNHADGDTNGVRGGLLALDAATGATRWTFEPELDQPGAGCGSVWGSPAIDEVLGHVVFGTGNCGADASTFTWNRHTEAVTALDLATGDVAWTFSPHQPNDADLDFGATPNIVTRRDGSRLVGIGNKDAVYYALDAATGGLVWSRQVALPGNVSDGFAIGGFIGSTATWRGDVYGATAIGGPAYYHSLAGATGAERWRGAAAPSYAASAVVNGVVLAGDVTATLRAFDARTGLLLAAVPLLGPIASGPAIAGSTVVVGSGLSSSDVCAKGLPTDPLCRLAVDGTLGSTGAVTALRPLLPR